MGEHPHQKANHNQGNSVKHDLAVYLVKCWSVITDAAVLMFFIIALYAVILYLCKMSWNLYISTNTGQMFVNYFPAEAESTSRLLRQDLIRFSLGITWHSFVVSLAVGSGCRLFYFGRYLYEQFGILGRTIVCGLPLSAIVASYVQTLYGFLTWDTAFVVVLFPTLSVYNRCFTYAIKLLPELRDVKKPIDTIKKSLDK